MTGPTNGANSTGGNTPAAPINWAKVAAAVQALVLAVIAGYHSHSIPSPVVTPTTPVVNPAPNSGPDGGTNQTQPTQPIQTTPITPVTSAVTVAYTGGQPVNGAVDEGRMFIVTAPVGVTVTPDVAAANDPDIDISVHTKGSKFDCVLRKGKRLQIIVSGVGDPSILSVQANTAAQPPPSNTTPNTTPLNPPVNPVNVSLPLKVGIVEDAVNRPPEVGTLFSNEEMWMKHRALGTKIHRWNGGASPSPEPDAQADIAAVKAAGKTLPAIVIRNSLGAILYCDKLPTDAATVGNLLSSWEGKR